MKIFVHSTSNPVSRREIDTHSLSFDINKSQFYMELGAPYIIYADAIYKPSNLNFLPNGTHIYFSEESMPVNFFSWLQGADEDAKDRFNNFID